MSLPEIHETTNHKGAKIRGHTNVVIGKYCAISDDARIQASNHNTDLPAIQGQFYRENFQSKPHFLDKGGIRIGHDVWIGAEAVILPGVTIGTGAVIGANATVTKDVEPYTIVGGTPAEKIKDRFDKETKEQLLDIAWWDWPQEKIQKNELFFHTDLNEFDGDIQGLIKE